MSRWLVPGSVITFMLVTSILASLFNSVISGQMVAASASISVAVLGLWLYFRKPSNN